jgi:Winged helix DNA-binding domain
MKARKRLTWTAVTARRMARSHLTRPAAGALPDDIATALCGVHAQILTAAELSIGRRIVGATRADVHRALWDERTLVKTFGPRGTVHLVAAADLPMWTGALSALPPSAPQHPDPVRFTPDQAEEVIGAIGDSLAGRPLTVDELTLAIQERLGPWAVEETMDAFQVKWPRWRQLTSTAAHRGVLCFGPSRGRYVTYTNPRTWLQSFRGPDDDDGAARRLLTRYLHAYGPANPQHFARWLAIPPGDAAELFAASAEALEPVDFEGEPAWVVAGDTATPAEPHRGVRLLPYFDAFVVAGQPRERLFPGLAATRALAGGQAGNFPVVLVDGVVGGVWHGRRSGRKLEITVEPIVNLRAKQRRKLDDEAGLVGAVMEATPTLTVGPVTVGPHA